MSIISIPGSTVSPCVIDPQSITIAKSPVPIYLDAALHWHRFGFQVIPIVPCTKKTAVKWNPWLADLSEPKITSYWRKHPDHEVGFIVGDDIIIFDADTPQSLARLCDIEEIFDVTPSLTIKTRKGEHHYFRRAEGVLAKSDSHSSDKHPERIDVKTGRAMVVLPPSGGKEVLIDES